MPGKNVPAQNGTSSAARASGRLNFDPDDPEYIRDLQRPAVIKEDLNEMERRKRVQQILESKAFRKELEHLITDERGRGNTNADNLQALERLSELIAPRMGQNGLEPTSPRFQGAGGRTLIPIADLRGTGDTSKYTKQERLLRTKLAALFRLINHFQWDQAPDCHATLRLAPESEEILINPDGLLYQEISAGSLAKVDLQGNILDHGNDKHANVSIGGHQGLLAIHRSRPDIRCVMQLNTPVVVAVSAMQCGLLPICQEAMIVGPVSIHERGHESGTSLESESEARDLGDSNKVLLLRNHGFVICGQSIEEVFHLAYHLVLACETQVRAARVGIENLCIPSEKARRRVYETTQIGGGGVNKVTDKDETIKWRVGELEWEAWMRVLDNAGHRTGHIYRQPVFRTRAPAAQSDVEVPPAACAYGLAEEKTETDNMLLIKPEPKVRWLNSPNVYHKVEFEESGTSEPKKLTKWIPDAADDAPHSNPIKITSPHQFTPLCPNAKEFKEKQRAIKEARRAENITAGPQSKILEGVTWEEAAKLKDAEASGTQEMIIVGAVSQGIIDRDYRHNAQIYRQFYHPNPFASITDEDIQRYIKDIERRQGAGGGLSDSSFASSSARETSESSPPQRTNTTTQSTTAAITSKVQRDVNQRYATNESSRATASDEEGHKESTDTSPEKKEKKKRFKTPSFLRSKKDKESKKKADR